MKKIVTLLIAFVMTFALSASDLGSVTDKTETIEIMAPDGVNTGDELAITEYSCGNEVMFIGSGAGVYFITSAEYLSLKHQELIIEAEIQRHKAQQEINQMQLEIKQLSQKLHYTDYAIDYDLLDLLESRENHKFIASNKPLQRNLTYQYKSKLVQYMNPKAVFQYARSNLRC